MANEAKKSTDESALDAVEKALSIDFNEDDELSDEQMAELEKSLAETADQLRDDSLQSEIEEATSASTDLEEAPATADLSDDLPETPPVPANDEHDEELRNLIYSIQRKPTSRIFTWTALASVIWLGLCAYYAYANVIPNLDQPVTFQTLSGNVEIIILIAAALVPLFPLWGFAVMLRRAHEMRHAAGSMIQASLRLLQPEKVANDSVATVGTAIRREMTAIGDGVERAIARAGELEFMVQKEVMNLERSYGDSEVRLRRLLDDIGNEREEVITHAEKLRNSITESQSGLTNEIEIASTRIDEQIKSAAGLLSETLDTQGVTITSRLKETSEGLIEVLTSTGAQIYSNLDSGTENLNTSVTERIREMSEVISTSGQAVATLIDGRTASFEVTADKINDKLETGKKAFEITFSERVEDLTKIMMTAGQSVSSLLKSSSAELAERSNKMVMDMEDNRKHLEGTLDTQSKQFGQLAGLASENLTSAIDAGSSKFEESAVRTAQRFEDSLSMRATDFENYMNESAEVLETVLSENLSKIDNTLSTSGTNLVSALGMRTEALGKVLEERSATIGQTIADRLSGFGQNLTGHVDDAVTRLKAQTDELEENTKAVEQGILARTQSVQDTVKASLSEFDQNLTGRVDDAVTRLKAQTDELQENTKAVEEGILARTQSVQDTVKASLSDFDQSLAGRVDDAVTRLQAQAEQLQENTKSVEDVILKRTQSVEETIKSSTIEFASGLTENLKQAADKSAELNDALEATAQKITDVLDQGSQSIADTLGTADEGLASSINEHTERLQEALNERANNLSSKLNQGIHRLSDALSTTGNKAAEELERNVSTLEQRLQENSTSIEKQFAAGSLIIQENLDKGRENLVQAISQSASDAGAAIDGKAEKLSSLLSERAELINNTLGKSLVDTQRELENKTSDINTLLTERTKEINTLLSERSEEINSVLSSRSSELTEIIERDAKPIVSSIEATGEAINNRLANMSKAVADEANTLFANLTSSNEQLEALINSATSNLSLMQSSLGEQSSGFADAVAASKAELEESNSIARGVEDRLQATSTNLLQNMASIAGRLETQGSVLQDATRLIDAAQANLNETLEGKQQSLQDLASGLVLRSDEINNSVSSFAQMISNMIEDIHMRTKGTGSEIAAEVSTAIDDATARFGDSVDAMRSAAATIRSELEDTREQMRRGVLELPDETAQNAAAMRRVVTDQIAALKDLSSIVEKSGKVLDTSVAAPVKAVAGGNTQRVPVQAAAAPTPPTPNFPPDTQASRPAPAFDSTLRGTQQGGYETGRTRQPQRPSGTQTPAPRAESGGWVSDLLRRASTDEPDSRPAPAPLPDTRSPDQFVESLNSLSMDIASAIDHEASVDLWERYKRGETNVFTRRLYTLQGQQTFDEIRSKYARETDFRNAVDRYIDDFERLLSDVSRSDQGGTMAQNYLTSDTGKVYTMLAHAAGRFGN